MLAHLRSVGAEVGRSAPLDVVFVVLEGGTPGDAGFDVDRHLEALAVYADLGVTGNIVHVAGDTLDAVIEAVEAYGAAVIESQTASAGLRRGR